MFPGRPVVAVLGFGLSACTIEYHGDLISVEVTQGDGATHPVPGVGVSGLPDLGAIPGPPQLDSDSDGIPDPTDRCPITPEDPDGLQSSDGCPEVDVDGDFVLDEKDECPTLFGSPERFGCPPEAPADGGTCDAIVGSDCAAPDAMR